MEPQRTQVSNSDFRHIFTDGQYVRYGFIDKVKAAIYHIKMSLFGKRLYGEQAFKEYMETFEKFQKWKSGELLY